MVWGLSVDVRRSQEYHHFCRNPGMIRQLHRLHFHRRRVAVAASQAMFGTRLETCPLMAYKAPIPPSFGDANQEAAGDLETWTDWSTFEHRSSVLSVFFDCRRCRREWHFPPQTMFLRLKAIFNICCTLLVSSTQSLDILPFWPLSRHAQHRRMSGFSDLFFMLSSDDVLSQSFSILSPWLQSISGRSCGWAHGGHKGGCWPQAPKLNHLQKQNQASLIERRLIFHAAVSCSNSEPSVYLKLRDFATLQISFLYTM